MRHTLAIASISAATLCGGCIYVGGSTRIYAAEPITQAEMTDMIGRTRDLRVGMGREEALGLYPSQHLNLKSSTSSEGSVFEEWQVEAYTTKGDVHFRRYLYFANNSLAAFSDTRIDYRDNPELLRGWAGR